MTAPSGPLRVGRPPSGGRLLQIFTGTVIGPIFFELIQRKVGKLREMSPLWEMVQEGIDLNTVKWAAH